MPDNKPPYVSEIEREYEVSLAPLSRAPFSGEFAGRLYQITYWSAGDRYFAFGLNGNSAQMYAIGRNDRFTRPMPLESVGRRSTQIRRIVSRIESEQDDLIDEGILSTEMIRRVVTAQYDYWIENPDSKELCEDAERLITEINRRRAHFDQVRRALKAMRNRIDRS